MRISDWSSDVCSSDLTISCMVAPARSTCAEPSDTRLTESSIRPLISLAAWALRCASERTSDATTAKPLPCSPARAASTAAFKARILVWKRSEEHTSELQSLMRNSYAAFCLTKKTKQCQSQTQYN